MQNVPTLQLMQRALRTNICRQCSQRPQGSESLDADTPRACEPDCTVFVHLPRLREIVSRIPADDVTLSRYERAVNELICQVCESSPTAGDYCGDRATRNCPLSRYLNRVVETLERVPVRS